MAVTGGIPRAANEDTASVGGGVLWLTVANRDA